MLCHLRRPGPGCLRSGEVLRSRAGLLHLLQALRSVFGPEGPVRLPPLRMLRELWRVQDLLPGAGPGSLLRRLRDLPALLQGEEGSLQEVL